MERDSGHDKLQLEIFRYFKETIGSQKPLTRRGYGSVAEFFLASVEVEVPMIVGTKTFGYLDVLLYFKAVLPKDATSLYWWVAVELKPRIYSCGALLRQVKQIETLCRATRTGRAVVAGSEVWVVIPKDDPLLSDFEEMADGSYHVIKWPPRG